MANMQVQEFLQYSWMEKRMLLVINDILKRLTTMKRGWTSLISDIRYNEMNKQAMNCLICFILAVYSEEAGKPVKWPLISKIAIYRVFKKVYVNYDTPEKKLAEIREIGAFRKAEFDEVTRQKIRESVSPEFEEFICEGVESFEMKLYKAATILAKYFELLEQRGSIDDIEYTQKYHQIKTAMEEFENLPGFKEVSDERAGDIYAVVKDISKLRNQNRWAVQLDNVACAVLGHLFETAMFAYIMSLEEKPGDENRAARAFFMGIFHDVAEAWTTDIPSPIKDSIPGFRSATEIYESKMLAENLYEKVPGFLAAKLKTVMFEDEENAEFHALIKGADYLSADAEIWRQTIAGSNDPYFLGVILRRKEGIKSGKALLTPACAKLHKYYRNYVFDNHYAIRKAKWERKHGVILTPEDAAAFEKKWKKFLKSWK